jgi:2-amino-4-hydroxy-6-hydroxymethyldihydropteridine diphosphokinase
VTDPSASRAIRAYIGLGSNLGDRISNLRAALRRLASGGVEIVGVSSVYETDPVGPEQPDFLNAAVGADTDLLPAELLAVMLQIEIELGRRRQIRWGPRTIDLDLLLYGNEVIDREHLKVPHPEITNRAFVLVPLLELKPDLELPSGEPLGAFCDPDPPGVRLFAPSRALLS